MDNLLSLLNLCFGKGTRTEDKVIYGKIEGITRAKEFLAWLIENNLIEKIGEGDINDYIRYIATTEDPIQTLIDLLK